MQFQIEQLVDNIQSQRLAKMERLRRLWANYVYKRYIYYAYTSFLIGCYITSIGPLIPYLAEKQGRLETEYSALLTSRSIGYFLGTLLIKVLESHLTYHQVMGYSTLFITPLLILFSEINNLTLRSLFFFVSALGCVQLGTYSNVLTMELFHKNRICKYLQLLHSLFALGGLVGPLLVYLFETHTYLIIVVCMLAAVPGYLTLSSPETKNLHAKSKTSVSESLLDENMEYSERYKSSVSLEAPFLTNNTAIILCVIQMFTVGQERLFGGWGPSFMVLSGYESKEFAGMYTSIYWSSITMAGFFMSWVPGLASTKIYILLFIGIFATVLSLFLVYHVDPRFGMIVSSILYGISNSALLPLLLSLAFQYGFRISLTQNSMFTATRNLSEATLVAVAAFLLENVSLVTFFYSLGAMSMFALLINHFLNKNLGERRESLRCQSSMRNQSSLNFSESDKYRPPELQ